jgi:intracellular multiplication protein IcmG
MTEDEHDSSHHETHMDDLHEEHTADHTEVWHDQPVDDFSDEPAAATVSDEQESGPTTETDLPPVKKRSGFLPIVIVVAGLLFLGVIGYMQFGSLLHPSASLRAPSNPTMIADQQGNVAPKTAMIPVGQPITAPPVTTQPAPALPPVQNLPIINNMPSPVPSMMPPVTDHPVSDANMGVPSFIPSATMNQPAQQPAPMPVANTPTISSPSTIGSTSASANSTSIAAKNPGQSDPAAAKIAELQNHVDDLQKSLADTTQKLAMITDKLNTPLPATTNPMTDDRLNRLEQKLIQIEQTVPHENTAPESATNMASNTPTDGMETQPVKTNKLARTSKHHPSRHHKKSKTTHRVASSHSTSSHWVLRAASAEDAWIAVDSETPALRHVQVGDELPGVGKVTSITEGDSGWTVQGTTGSIH